MSKSGQMTCSRLVMLVMALVVLSVSVAMLSGCYQAIVYTVMHKQMMIRKGSTAYLMWKTTPVPLTMKIYIFNLTNPEDFKQGHTPVLQECGPYVWREYQEKKNLTFHPNNTVTYYQQRWWVWDQELSGNNSKDDVIVSLNTIPVGMVWSTRKRPFYDRMVINTMIEMMEDLFVVATVDQIMFTGVEIPILAWLQKNVVADNGTFHTFKDYIGPGSTTSDKFAWFYKRNMSMESTGIYNIMTGADDLANLGNMDWWNYNRETTFFTTPCNKVTGSSGDIYPPHQGRDYIIFFKPDLCMSIHLPYKEETRDKFGLHGYRYWGSNTTFANESVVPGNKCYCVKETCAPTGLLPMESCYMGIPVFISFPHFFNGDPLLLNGVHGLAPNEDKHTFFIDLIPELGIPMRVASRLQINFHVQPSSVEFLKDVPDVYLPMIWLEIQAELTPDLAAKITAVNYLLQSSVTNVIIWCVLILGALLTMVLLGGNYCGWRCSCHAMYSPVNTFPKLL